VFAYDDGDNPQYVALRYRFPDRKAPRLLFTGSVAVHIIDPPASTKFGEHEKSVVFWPFTLANS